ncbi:hypothetical protein ACSSS7_000119 [Eimeria intestinalis]
MLEATVPFTAVAGANVANIYCMRGQECIKGIPVFSEGGQQLGVSRRAGVEAVKQTAISRVGKSSQSAACMQCMHLQIFTELSVIYGCIAVGFPLGVAVYPATAKLPISELEPEFQGLSDEEGRPITRVMFNKGI